MASSLRWLVEPLLETASTQLQHHRLVQQHHQAALSKNVIVAMSGGVDSSVAALLLQQQLAKTTSSLSSKRQPLIGLYMSNWNDYEDIEDDDNKTDDHDKAQPISSCREQDYKDAKAVASTLGIPLQHVSFGSDYWTQVFEPYCQSIAKGVMPNPDTACNIHIKFGSLLDFLSKKWGPNQYTMATGHYARLWHRQSSTTHFTSYHSSSSNFTNHATTIMPPPPDVQEVLDLDPVLADWLPQWGHSSNAFLTPLLLFALDQNKDQTYFLSGVPGKAFSNVMFPLGDLLKNNDLASETTNYTTTAPSVRSLAQQYQLPTATKKDSVGLCFVGKRRNFPHFIQQYLPHPLPPGVFIDVDTGRIMGHHDGPGLLLTVGQGAKISGSWTKWYVVGRDAHNPSNIWVAPGKDHPALYTRTVQIHQMNWMAGIPPPPLLAQRYHQSGNNNVRMPAWCRSRHLYDLVPCDLEWDAHTHRLTVHSHAPLRAVTPGQTMAIYVGSSSRTNRSGMICLGGGPVAQSYHQLGKEVMTSRVDTTNMSFPTSSFEIDGDDNDHLLSIQTSG